MRFRRQGKNPFGDHLKGKVVFLGIGNILRGDDAAGPLLVQHLKDLTEAVCINAENAPERYVGRVVRERPDTVVMIDAVFFPEKPGAYRLMAPEELESVMLSTHGIPLSSIASMIEEKSGARVYILGIRPGGIGIGQGLTSQVRKTIRKLGALLREAAG